MQGNPETKPKSEVKIETKEMPGGRILHTVKINGDAIGYIEEGKLVPYKDTPDIYLSDLVEIMRLAKEAGLWKSTGEGK